MAKGKRASLKDKDSDSLGLTQKKGKGIDLLFGGPSSAEEANNASEAGSENDLTGLVKDSAAVDTSLSGITTADDRLVDELGLPVALEAPPDDLILASSSPAESLSATGGEDAVDPSMSPFAMPTTAEGLEGSETTGDTNDLSGILVEDVSPIAEEENLSSPLQENDLSGIVDESTSPDTVPAPDTSGMAEDDLSGMIVEDSSGDLSGMAPTSPDIATTTPAVEPSYTPPPTTPPPATFPPSTPPPTTAAPINVPPTTTPQAGTASTRVPPVTLDTFAGVVTGATPVSEEAILPEDALTERGDHTLAVEKRSQLEQDDAITEKVLRYIGRERRERLDQEIESLYERVAKELSDNKDDAAFALKTLSEAQDIVIEDPRQYDEALYRVAVVKTMLARASNLRRWSYSWGMVVFFYAIVWLVVFIAGFSIDLGAMADTSTLSEAALAIRSAWVSALAGGLGSIIAILYSLSWRVAYKHEFDRQYIMKYLVQPFMGFLLGAVIFFITSAGFLVLGGNSATPGSQYLGGDQLIMVQILLGIIAGFRQRVVYYMIDKIVQRLSPTVTETKGPTSVVPTEDYARLQEAEETGSQ